MLVDYLALSGNLIDRFS